MRRVPLLALLSACALAQSAGPAPLVERGRFPLRDLAGPPPATDLRVPAAARDFFATALEPAFAAGQERYADGVPWTRRADEAEAPSLNVDLFAVSFPSLLALPSADAPNATVHGWYYRPRDREEPGPALVLLHHLQDDQTIEHIVADAIAARGIGVFLMYLPHYGPRRGAHSPRDLDFAHAEVLHEQVSQGILDIHLARDFLAAQEENDPARLGLLGISLGGIVGSLAAGVDPGFEGGCVFVIAGGDFAKMIFNGSREVRSIARSFDALGMDEDAVRAALVPVEPLGWAHRIDDRVQMFNVTEDEIIPRSCTEQLAETISGEVELAWYAGSHVMLGLYVAEILDRIEGFVFATEADRQ